MSRRNMLPRLCVFLVMFAVITVACGSDDEGPKFDGSGGAERETIAREYVDGIDFQYQVFADEINRCAGLDDQHCQSVAVEQLYEVLRNDPPPAAKWMDDAHNRLRAAIGRMLVINGQLEVLTGTSLLLNTTLSELAAAIEEIQSARMEFVRQSDRLNN